MEEEIQRSGTTLTEVCLMMGILLILATVIVAGTVDVRETARRQQCTENLRGIGQAVAAYDVAQGKLPRSGYWDPIYGGWGATLLPYIGEKDLATKYDYAHNWYDDENREVVSTSIKKYLCPSTPEPRPVKPLKVLGEIRPNREAAAGDYMAPRGVIDKRVVPDSQFGALGALAWFNQVPRRSDITDGLSNTLMISEQAARWGHWVDRKLQPDQEKQTYAMWVGAWASYNAIWVRTRPREGAAEAGMCGVNCNNSDGFYSFHEDGVNALMVDGAVRQISNRIDDTILFSLITRAGGEVIGAGDF